jgi:hypothetical protein
VDNGYGYDFIPVTGNRYRFRYVIKVISTGIQGCYPQIIYLLLSLCSRRLPSHVPHAIATDDGDATPTAKPSRFPSAIFYLEAFRLLHLLHPVLISGSACLKFRSAYIFLLKIYF